MALIFLISLVAAQNNHALTEQELFAQGAHKIQIQLSSGNSWIMGSSFQSQPISQNATGPDAWLMPEEKTAFVDPGTGPCVIGIGASGGSATSLAGFFSVVSVDNNFFTSTGVKETLWKMTTVDPSDGKGTWLNAQYDDSSWVPAITPGDCLTEEKRPIWQPLKDIWSRITPAQLGPSWFESCNNVQVNVWFRLVIPLVVTVPTQPPGRDYKQDYGIQSPVLPLPPVNPVKEPCDDDASPAVPPPTLPYPSNPLPYYSPTPTDSSPISGETGMNIYSSSGQQISTTFQLITLVCCLLL